MSSTSPYVLASRARELDELLQRSAEAVNSGDLERARELATRVLAEDAGNLDASRLLAAEGQDSGEVRRLTVMFCDLVGSTALSGRLDPELYRSVLSRYRKLATDIIETRHGGHVASIKGDGLLALFGYPQVHGNDTERAVQSGLDIAAAVQELSAATAQAIGTPLAVRAAVHRGLLYIDPEQDDVYGLAANVAARLQELAAVGTVVISEAVHRLVDDRFETEAGTPTVVKGVDEEVTPYTVTGRRAARLALEATTPLVGRGAELLRLREAWEEARAGGSAVVLGLAIVGEAGIGKTRIAAAFSTEVGIAGGTVVHLGGSSDHQRVGFQPIRALIEGRCGIRADTAPVERLRLLSRELDNLGFTVTDSVPLLAPVLDLDPDTGYELTEAEGRKLSDEIAKAVAEYVLACLGEGPALLLVEDLHFMDDATRDLIDRVLRSGRDHTVLVVTTRGRPPHRTEVLELGPLHRDACAALADAIAPPGSRTADRADLLERSDGVPLFLEELVRSSLHEPVEEVHRPARSAASTVPDVLYEPLMARLHGSPARVAVAAAAATIGRTVDRAMLHAVTDLTADEVEEGLHSLVEGRILEPTADGEAFRFRHELIRDVAYDLLPPTRRREVHSRVADLLDAPDGDQRGVDWPVLASHLERADRSLEAAEAFARASDSARRRGDLVEARHHLGQAVELILRTPSSPERDAAEIRYRLQRGFIVSTIEGPSGLGIEADFERCMELTVLTGRSAELISTLTSMWGYYLSRGDLENTRQVSITLRDLCVDELSFWVPQNMASFGMVDWFAGHFTSAVSTLQAAMDELDQAAERDVPAVRAWYLPTHPTVAMHLHLGLAHFMDGDLVSADACARNAFTEADALGFPEGPWSASYSHWLLSWMHVERGDVDRAFAELDALGERAARHGYDSFQFIGMTLRTALAIFREVAAGRAALLTDVLTLESLLAGWEMAELRSLLPTYLTILGAGLESTGDLEGARARYERSLALAESTGMHIYDAETRRRLAHLETDAASTTRELTAALDLAETQGARPFQLRIALDLHDLRGDAALDVLRAAVATFRPDSSYPELDEARRRITRAE